MRRFSKVCRRSAALLSLVAFVGSSTLLPSLADAQPRRPTNGANGGGKKPKSQPQEIELDAPAAPAAGQPGAAPVDSGPPPVPGQMTPAAANAKRQFDAEQWAPASLNLYKVWKGETNDDEGNKQLAEYHLAEALPGLLQHLQRDLGPPLAPEVQRLPPLAGQAGHRPSRAGRHRQPCRKVQRSADREVQQPRAARPLLAAELPARSLQVRQSPVCRLDSPLQQGGA
jgi:hypothetical protein